ncbi:MAG: hypothetical protein IT307_16355, partial [Chloroflexi bacterium]|nr:hypothetical protein [Chloroflexota bacterium]
MPSIERLPRNDQPTAAAAVGQLIHVLTRPADAGPGVVTAAVTLLGAARTDLSAAEFSLGLLAAIAYARPELIDETVASALSELLLSDILDEPMARRA